MTQESTLTHESASGRGSAAGEPRIALLLNGDGLAVNAIMLSPDRAYEPPPGHDLAARFPAALRHRLAARRRRMACARAAGRSRHLGAWHPMTPALKTIRLYGALGAEFAACTD